jgi:hypothetical protein
VLTKTESGLIGPTEAIMNDRTALLALEALSSPHLADAEQQARALIRRNASGVRPGISPSAGLSGPHRLDPETIAAIVSRKAPGAYALGRSEGQTFYIRYVGRSDEDVAAALARHVGDYQHFKFAYFGSARAAFEKECQLYHDFGEAKLNNKLHPLRPSSGHWHCPRCRIFDY